MKIDILMATYNGEKYLKEQIESILNQSYSNFRLIISDDCSIDSTIDILHEYANKDDRIIVYKQEKNLGVVKNFEFLLNKVENELFMFSDQDDVWKKDKISKSFELINSTNSDMIYSDLEVVDENLNIISTSFWRTKGFLKKVKHNNFESLYLNNYITGSTMLVKSKWLEKILPLPKKSEYILHDYWTALIVSYYGKMSYLKEPQVYYRQHRNNEVGSSRKSDALSEFSQIRNLFIDVKLDHFRVLMDNFNKFECEDINDLNKKSYTYFENLQNNIKISFMQKKLFWDLYKYENFKYAFENYLILNKPNLASFLYNLKKKIKE